LFEAVSQAYKVIGSPQLLRQAGLYVGNDFRPLKGRRIDNAGPKIAPALHVYLLRLKPGCLDYLLRKGRVNALKAFVEIGNFLTGY
jgi:hypothetical protein